MKTFIEIDDFIFIDLDQVIKISIMDAKYKDTNNNDFILYHVLFETKKTVSTKMYKNNNISEDLHETSHLQENEHLSGIEISKGFKTMKEASKYLDKILNVAEWISI